MKIFEVTLVYKNGSTWFAGQFNSEEDLNAWIDLAKKQIDWDPETEIQVADKSEPPVNV